jgi:hypothetical protein
MRSGGRPTRGDDGDSALNPVDARAPHISPTQLTLAPSPILWNTLASSRDATPNPRRRAVNENDILIRCGELEWQPTFPGGWI